MYCEDLREKEESLFVCCVKQILHAKVRLLNCLEKEKYKSFGFETNILFSTQIQAVFF